MRYVKFFAKCILAALPFILVIGFTAFCPNMYMDEEYPAWRFSKAVSSGKEYVGKDFDTIILGDSGAMSSMMPDMMSDSTVNLAVGGGTSIEAYYFLKEYVDNHKAPKNVIVMFAPFHYYTADNYETRTMYFKTLSIKDAKEVYELARKTGDEKIFNKDTYLNEFSYRMALPTKYLPAIKAARIFGRYKGNIDAYNRLVDDMGYGPFGTADGCDAVSYESARSWVTWDGEASLLAIYLYNIYNLCVERDINLLILQPALNEASYNALNADYVKDYYDMLNISKATYVEATVETTLRCYPNEYFGDVSHLNGRGAEKFTREILETYPEYFSN